MTTPSKSISDYINFSGGTLFLSTLFLSIFGSVMIYSSTVCKSVPVYQFFLKQIFAITAGLFLCSILASIKYQSVLKKITYPLYVLTVLLLIAVLFTPKIKGAHRWLPVPFLGYFQPSELARVTSVLITAKLLDEYRSKIATGKKELWFLIGSIFFICFLIIIQPDSGIPAIILIVTLSLLFISSVKLKHIIKIMFIAILILFASLCMKPFAKQRILSFFSTKNYEKSTSYQIEQSLLALSRGGMFGCGLGKGMFKEHYLPEIHTDFILCTVGEELGFLGSFITVLTFVLLTISGFSIAYKSFNTPGGFYGGLLAAGLTLNLTIQAYLNIAVATKLFLPKGIGLPFVSYGGSAIIMSFVNVGIILSVWQNIKSK